MFDIKPFVFILVSEPKELVFRSTVFDNTEVDGVPECKTITWKLNKKGYRNKQLYLLLHLCTSLLPQALLSPCNVHSLQKTALAATTWYNVSRLLSMLQEVFSYLGNKKLLNFCNLSQTGEKFASHHTSRE